MKILISSASFGKDSVEAVALLEESGFTPVRNPYGRKFEQEEFFGYIQDAVGLIAGTEKITEELLARAPCLRAISRYGAGTDNIDFYATEKRGIIVCNTPDAPSQAVAELTLSLILGVLRRVSEADRLVRHGTWSQLTGSLLQGKIVGLIGLGRIGKKVAGFLRIFDVRILAYDPFFDDVFASECGVENVPLEYLISQADILSFHLPFSENMRHFFGRDQFLLMKTRSFLINTSRGGLIDEEALVEALENKILAGAALDTFEREPYSGQLTQFENVVFTCHMGSATIETRKQMEYESVQNLIRALKKN